MNNTYNNFIPKNTASKVLHTGRGFVHGIYLTLDNQSGTYGTLTLYDNTAASGNILIRLNIYIGSVGVIQFDRIHALKFSIGLTVVTTQYCDAYVLTET